MDKVVNEEYDLKEQIRINEVIIDMNVSEIRSMKLFSAAYGTPEEATTGIIKLKENIEKRRDNITLLKNKQKTWGKYYELRSKIAEIEVEQFQLNVESMSNLVSERFNLIDKNHMQNIQGPSGVEHINILKQEMLKLQVEFNEMYYLYAEK